MPARGRSSGHGPLEEVAAVARLSIGVFCALAVTAGCLCWSEAQPPGAKAASPADALYADPDNLQNLISKQPEPFYIVDVRTSDEYQAGHIPTAINIPWDTIGEHPPTPYTSTLIIVYCASGIRSAKAKAALDKLGYTRVVDFGSISRWKGQTLKGEDPGECPCKTL